MLREHPPELPRIADYAAWHARRAPDAEALVLGERRVSYADLDAAINDLAKAFMAAGVGKGDRVATLQTPHPDFFVSFLAATTIGAIWVGLNPRYRRQELAHVLRDSAPALLLTRTRIEDRDYKDDLLELGAEGVLPARVVLFADEPALSGADSFTAFLEAGRGVSDADLAARRDACGGRDPCLIVYTSGSTGKPKGALLDQAAIIAFSLVQNRLWPVEPLRALNFLPINHIGCVVDLSTPCLTAGGTIVFMEQFDAAASVRAIETERLTAAFSVPSVFALQAALPEFDTVDQSSLQLAVWEGAAIPSDTLERLAAVAPRLATNYSLTEALAITIVEPTVDRDVLLQSVGFPFPGVEVRLIDADGHDVADGEGGEIVARSPYLFSGYWRQPEATAAAFTPDGFFRTGDLAVRRPDGRYRIVGRLKEMYKSGGYNVYPREVEAAIEEHPAVALAAVVAAPDPLWQEVGVAYVMLNAAAEPGDLAEWCRARLANYKVPKRFFVEPELPLLPIGKVDKVALRERAARAVEAD